MKRILIIGIILILLGGVFCGAAYALGEKYVDSQLSGSSAVFSSNEVNKIYISDIVADIKFYKSESGDIAVKAENIVESEFKCQLNGGTLEISYNPETIKFGFISLPSFIFEPAWKTNSPVIEVYIPEGKIFDEVYFNGGLGSIETEQLNAKSLIINGGVGDYDIKNIYVESLKIGVGMGSVKIDGIINGDTKIEGGVGDIKITGQANGNIKINAGMGNITLNMAGNLWDYNIKADKGLGSINLNGKKMPDLIKNGGTYNIDIDAGVGSIDINIGGDRITIDPGIMIPDPPEMPEMPEPADLPDPPEEPEAIELPPMP